MLRGELVASAKRILRMVDAVLPSRSPKKQRPAYLILKDYIELAERESSKEQQQEKE